MILQKHWYLGFLGFVGIWFFPATLSFFQGTGTWWDGSNALWLLWFLYFIPEPKGADTDV